MAGRAAARRSVRPDRTAATIPVTSRAGEPLRNAPNAWCSLRRAYLAAWLRSRKRCAASVVTRRMRPSSRLRYFAEERMRRARSSAAAACDSAMLATAIALDQDNQLLVGETGP